MRDRMDDAVRGRGKRRCVWFVRPAKMIWALVIGAAVASVWSHGTAHIRYEYVWSGPESHPFYHECYYFGLHSRRVFPRDGKCPLILFLRPAGKEE